MIDLNKLWREQRGGCESTYDGKPCMFWKGHGGFHMGDDGPWGSTQGDENQSPAQVVHEDCRWCRKPSREGHPAGVVSGLWYCTGCMQWQQTDDELTDSLDERKVVTQLEEA